MDISVKKYFEHVVLLWIQVNSYSKYYIQYNIQTCLLGMHALGWTTEQAVEFMLTHTAASPENIRGEVKMAN